MNNKEDSKKKKKIDLIVKIIIIIILLIHNCSLIGKEKKNNGKIPTGNVDIIEIICDKENVCNSDNTNSKVDNDKENKFEVTIPAGNEEPIPKEEINELIVYDKDITWHDETPAKIFTNSMYELTDVIAPESSNTYQFVVKNGTEYNLKYKIDFIENNPYQINMKYKLKKNDTYIIDHYVSANELNIEDFFLNAKTNDTYYLEWKWISSSNDTKIGLDPNSKYGLKIYIEAESTDE